MLFAISAEPALEQVSPAYFESLRDVQVATTDCIEVSPEGLKDSTLVLAQSDLQGVLRHP